MAPAAEIAAAENRNEYCESIFEDLPCAVLVLNNDVRVVDFNRSGFRLMHEGADQVVNLLLGDALGCTHAHESPGGCGTTPACSDCVLRKTAEETVETGEKLCAIAPMKLFRNDTATDVRFLVATAQVSMAHGALILATLQDLSDVRVTNPRS